MLCSQCGMEIADNSEFCGHCGARVSAAAQAGPPPPPPAPPAAAPPAASMGAAPAGPGQYPPPAKKSVLPWVLGGIALAAIVALVLVLVFVVFGGEDSGVDTSGPEKVVEDFYQALVRQDVDMLLGTFEPSYLEELEDVLGGDLESFFEEYFFTGTPEDLEVEIRKMETEIDGDEATVTIVDGTLSYTDEYGDEVSEEAAESDMEPLQLVKVDGKWYLSADYLIDQGVDPDELEGLDLDGSSTRDGDDGGEDEELADVEAAMLAYAEENSAAGLEFEIFNLFIEGDEAAAVAICTNQELEAPFILMEKGSSGWEGVDFGTGWDPPAWYEEKISVVEDAMIAYVKENAAEGLEFEIVNLLIKGNEAAGVAICTNQEVDAPLVIMEKGPGGWYGVDVGTGIDGPSWYEAILY